MPEPPSPTKANAASTAIDDPANDLLAARQSARRNRQSRMTPPASEACAQQQNRLRLALAARVQAAWAMVAVVFLRALSPAPCNQPGETQGGEHEAILHDVK
jgi:hypothetical protein